MYKDKTVILGVTGGIAAYKAPEILRKIIYDGGDVNTVMTKNAAKFITPLTFHALSGKPVLTDMFEASPDRQINHIHLAESADLIIVAPATANVLGKVANGIADDLLTTLIMAATAPVLFAPAMNLNMYANRIVQDNIKKLQKYGYYIIEPEYGKLATGIEGKGRLADTGKIYEKGAEILKSKK